MSNSKKRRRANGEGYIRRRKDGTWEVRILIGYNPETGAKKCKSFYGKTRTEAVNKFNAFRLAQASGIDMTKNFSFSEYAALWYEGLDEISATTRESYKYTLRILNEHLGMKKIRDLQPYDVQAMLKKLKTDGKSASTISKVKGMCSQICQMALANRIVCQNAVAVLPKSKRKEPKSKKDAFTADEVTTLMNCLGTDRIAMAIRILLFSGLRIGELLALEPRHIIIEPNGTAIMVEQAVQRTKGKVSIGPPKSASSIRRVPLPESLRGYAIALRETERVGDRFIFESPRVAGQPINPSFFSDQYRAAIEKIPGVRYLPVHCTRHTYASHAQSQGVDPFTLKGLLGHSTVDMSAHYVHTQRYAMEAAAEKLNNAFSFAKSPCEACA